MSWSTIKTSGIILRVDPLQEVDRRYRFLTPDLGKLDFIGRGAQKIKAKLAPHLEPFALVDIEVVRGRRRTTVISVERQRVFRRAASELDHRLLAQSALTLIDRYTREQDEDAALYQELCAWLEFCDSEFAAPAARRTLLLAGFLLRAFDHLGYRLELETCLACKKPIVPLAYRWHSGKGGLVCSDCIARDRTEWFAARSVDEEVIKLLRFAREAPYFDLLRPSLVGEQVQALAAIVQDIIFYHLPGDYEVPFWSGVLADYELEGEVEKL